MNVRNIAPRSLQGIKGCARKKNSTMDFFIFILVIAIGAIMYRLIKGPSIADRVAAFDVLTCAAMGVIGLLAVKNDNMVYVDIVLIMSLVVFLGAIAFAYYLQKRKN